MVLVIEDGSNVTEWEVHRRRHPMSKGNWDIGVVKVVKSKKQVITLDVWRKCREHWSGRSQIVLD